DDPNAVGAPTVAAPAMAAPTVVAPAVVAPTVVQPHAGSTHYGPPHQVQPPLPPYGGGPRRRRGMLAAVVAAVVAVAAIAVVAVVLLNRGGGAPPPTAAPQATGGPQAPPAAPSAAADGVQVFDVATDNRFGSGSARFATPSGNIACALATGEARCDVRERSWQIPATPAGCDLAYGTGAVLTAGQKGKLSCVGDTLSDPSLQVLAYGQAVRLGDVVCTSRETGVRCEDGRSGHGFAVARASYELY
ncbi:DUF6636 domain-containing protein, partial [Pseudonocardia aurantiaca]